MSGAHSLASPLEHRLAGRFQLHDQLANFFVGLAGNAGSVQRRDLIGWPADAARAQADLLGPQALGNAEIDRGT